MSQTFKGHAWRDLAVFEDLEASVSLETFLRQNGVEARTYDDKAFRYFLFLRPPRVTYRVQVRSHQFTNAARLLAAGAPAVISQAIHCESCGSLRVNYPQMTRKFILPTIMLHLGILLRVIDHGCYCEDCHYMWNLPGDAPTRKIRAVRWFPF